jgi:hypothetical protein
MNLLNSKKASSSTSVTGWICPLAILIMLNVSHHRAMQQQQQIKMKMFQEKQQEPWLSDQRGSCVCRQHMPVALNTALWEPNSMRSLHLYM